MMESQRVFRMFIHAKGWAVVCVIATLLLGIVGPARAVRPADFGRQWVRSNDFTVIAASGDPNILNITTYADANLSAFYPYGSANQIFTAGNANYPWMGSFHTDWNQPFDPNDGAMQWIDQYENGAFGGLGWNLADEVIGVWMQKQGGLFEAYQQSYPNKLTWAGSTGLTLPADYMYGGAAPLGYNADQYLENLITAIQPDVIAAVGLHVYTDNRDTKDVWFTNIMKVRQKTQEHGLSFFQWIQAFELASEGLRLPSESDLRAQVFASLTAGAKGIVYGAYSGWHDRGLLNPNGAPSPLYAPAASLNAELEMLGQSLKFLDSTDVRFVPGSHAVNSSNSTPDELTNWASGAGGDSHIQSAAVGAGQLGAEKNGLIGFFTDDADQQYFMLTNLNHGGSMSAPEAAMSFVITFDPSVNSIWRLNRATGLAEEIALTNHALNWSLPGGTGDLFKYDNGNFAGVVPEPAGATMLLLAASAMLRKQCR